MVLIFDLGILNGRLLGWSVIGVRVGVVGFWLVSLLWGLLFWLLLLLVSMFGIILVDGCVIGW